ncbi:MAG: arylesterase [Kordiimonadaceae bacterium]|nr:arylesterase [Kordiimonadaceae bacterium]
MLAIGPLKIFTFAVITSFFTVFAPVAAENATNGAANNDKALAPLEILAFGDSLTAGYGLPPGEGFTDQLQVWLSTHINGGVKVTNGGVSGDTSSGGRSRLDWALSPIKNGQPDLVILELGANDALRGVSPVLTRENMDAMVAVLTARNIPVLIAGMRATPSWGPEYSAAFDGIFPDLAQKYNVPLYPFFLEGVVANPALNQSDGLHPTKEGVAIIVNKIGPVVAALLSP